VPQTSAALGVGLGILDMALSVRTIESCHLPGRIGDGNGLYLFISKTGRKTWLFRYMRDRQAHEKGLGSYPAISLSQAREKAAECRRQLALGQDPIQQARAATVVAKGQPSFAMVATELIAMKRRSWRGPLWAEHWQKTLLDYAAPLGPLPIDRVDTAAILAVLSPLQRRVPDTASRLRSRIEQVLNYAATVGYRDPDKANSARWKGHLEYTFAAAPKGEANHHAAMGYHALPDFMQQLRGSSPPRPHKPDEDDTTGDNEPPTLSNPCPCCGGRMLIIKTFARGCEPKYQPATTPS
jgi:Arm DNA-binding domain